MSHVPVIDLSPWYSGTDAERAAVVQAVDAALTSVGFMLITGHPVPTELASRLRAAARDFFALPEQVKSRYAAAVAGRGWLPPGVEANAYADAYDENGSSPPDLKETWAVGADAKVGDPVADAYWFPDNVWPDEVPALRAVQSEYLAQMRNLADELLTICALALGQQRDFFTRHTEATTFTMNINWYPPLTRVGPPQQGQFRIGPHTDFGTVTILDREPGTGGLQVWTEQDGWEDAPFVPGSLTINTGDLLARWSGLRWKSNRHRVLAPQESSPDEDLMSLIYFYEADHDTAVTPLAPPLGRVGGLDPVVSGAFIKERLDAISVG